MILMILYKKEIYLNKKTFLTGKDRLQTSYRIMKKKKILMKNLLIKRTQK